MRLESKLASGEPRGRLLVNLLLAINKIFFYNAEKKAKEILIDF